MSLGENSLVAAYQRKGQLKSRPSGTRVVTNGKRINNGRLHVFFKRYFRVLYLLSRRVSNISEIVVNLISHNFSVLYPFPIDLYGLNSWFMIPEFHHGPNEAPGLFQVIFTFANFSCIVIFLSSNTSSFEFISIGNELAFIARTRIFQVSQV